MVTTVPDDPMPASPEAQSLATEAIARFPSCFWFRAKGAPVVTRGDVALVLRRLRQHGDRAAWEFAGRLERCP